jgi:hypothetical protein
LNPQGDNQTAMRATYNELLNDLDTEPSDQTSSQYRQLLRPRR